MNKTSEYWNFIGSSETCCVPIFQTKKGLDRVPPNAGILYYLRSTSTCSIYQANLNHGNARRIIFQWRHKYPQQCNNSTCQAKQQNSNYTILEYRCTSHGYVMIQALPETFAEPTSMPA